MTLRVCLDCTTAFAVGVPLCPHCGSERHAEQGSAAALGIHAGVPVETEEDNMPKITKHGGATVAGESVPAVSTPPAGPEPETTSAAAPERPAATDPKSAWLDYAASLGVDGAEEMTKKQLIDATTQGAE